MSLFQIPGNIKQRFNPFSLLPESDLNAAANSSKGISKNAKPQLFSYKNESQQYRMGGYAKLNFYPSSLDSLKISDDISFKLLYNRPDAEGNFKSITIEDILESIPGVQIREFLPDTRLDQCINFFKDIMESMADLLKSDGKKSSDNSKDSKKSDKEDSNSLKDIARKIRIVSEYTIKYMTGSVNPNFYTDLAESLKIPFASYKEDIYAKPNSAGFYVMTFPYVLYYRLQSCVTTNIYEVPCGQGEKKIISSGGGMKGWTDGGDDFMSAGGFRLSNLLGKIPGVGSLANMILGNIGINYTPWWNAGPGSHTQEPEITITFDLYNDNIDAAIKNFVFVNTIVPNNKWIQYNMFQHSSSLYDVKIEGINRLYACAGDFSVTYEGILRDPPEEFYLRITPMINSSVMNVEAFKANMRNNKLIKIPDVYRVSLKFQSLLPANFNNYIFNYAENNNHISRYGTESVYQSSIAAEAFGKGVGNYIKRAREVWNSETYVGMEKNNS